MDILPELVGRVKNAHNGILFEIIFVDDQSADKSWEVICELAKLNNKNLIRN